MHRPARGCHATAGGHLLQQLPWIDAQEQRHHDDDDGTDASPHQPNTAAGGPPTLVLHVVAASFIFPFHIMPPDSDGSRSSDRWFRVPSWILACGGGPGPLR